MEKIGAAYWVRHRVDDLGWKHLVQLRFRTLLCRGLTYRIVPSHPIPSHRISVVPGSGLGFLPVNCQFESTDSLTGPILFPVGHFKTLNILPHSGFWKFFLLEFWNFTIHLGFPPGQPSKEKTPTCLAYTNPP